MQIGSGQSSLALAMLQSLGVAAPGAAQPAAKPPVASSTAAGPSQQPEKVKAAAPAGPDLGVEKAVPRGSFIDLRV
jgi:hypothetical protein